MNGTAVNSQLNADGFAFRHSHIEPAKLDALAEQIFLPDQPGVRCLLDLPPVASTACTIGQELITAGILDQNAVAIQAIAFDKTATTNWKVTWHQDLMFPFASPVSRPDYTLPSVKDGIDFARPPLRVLQELLAVRLHLDDCPPENGPLRVAPKTHRMGIVLSADVQNIVEISGEVLCPSARGELLLMRPLLLHASSKATAPSHRRVLHLVYHSGAAMSERWHRAIAPE